MHRRAAQKSLIPLGDEEGIYDTTETPKRRSSINRDSNKRKLKRLRRRRKDGICDKVFIGILFTAIAVFIFLIAFAFVLVCSWIANPHNAIFDRGFRNGKELDHDMYRRRHTNILPLDISNNKIELDQADHDYLVSYGSEMMQKGCDITVFIMNPRLLLLKSSAPWFTLESVAAFLPNACVVLQTGKINGLTLD